MRPKERLQSKAELIQQAYPEYDFRTGKLQRKLFKRMLRMPELKFYELVFETLNMRIDPVRKNLYITSAA